VADLQAIRGDDDRDDAGVVRARRLHRGDRLGTGVSGPVAALLRQFIPEMTINPDFIEWFHRVWAMVTGFLIIGVAGWTWFGDRDRRTRLAATLAVAILPLQITVGALTVTLGGLVPGGYTVSTHAAHLIVALAIFTLLGLATIWGGGRGSPRLLRAAIGVARRGRDRR